MAPPQQPGNTPTQPRAGLPGGAAGLGLAGLIDGLHPAAPLLPRRPARPRRSAAFRAVPARRMPLPPARPAAVPQSVPAARSESAPHPVSALHPAAAAGPVPVLAGGARAHGNTSAEVPAGRRGRLRGLVRRLALWGAGPDRAYCSWGAGSPRGSAAPSTRSRELARPVVLRELPSTPTVQPVASSPAPELRPRGPAGPSGPAGPRAPSRPA